MPNLNLTTLDQTFIIAEVGINHNGDIEKAKKLIDAASLSGYDAVKFQTYKTETRIPDLKSEIFAILKKCELKYTDFKILKDYANSKNIEFMSTVFHEDDFNYLDSIENSVYKIASFDLTNLKLIDIVSRSNKAIIVSTGMANISEINKAFDILKKNTVNFCLLHCVSSYPLLDEKANLNAIKTLYDKYQCVVGYSDHTDGIIAPVYATAVGSKVIEKHFKIDDDCVDASVSIDVKQSKEMISKIRKLEKILGNGKKECQDIEKGTKIFRKIVEI